MSAVGFDFRNERCVVAVAKDARIVCFDEEQRFLGVTGVSTTNPKNSISQIMRLIGRPFSDPDLQQDLKGLPFSVTEGPDGFPLIHARYRGERKSFTPIQVMGIVFTNMKRVAENNSSAPVVDCCIGIPVYFTDLQRRAVLEAAKIAGLNPLRLMHETTATALAYGIYKTDLPENKPIIVAFVDIGNASMQVCIAGFKKGEMKILAHSFDRGPVGRAFDEVLFQHFAEKFMADYEIDVFYGSAQFKLRAACEKLKEVLASNPEASLYVECLIGKKYVRGFIEKEEFEHISSSILERVKKPLKKALSDAKVTVDDISAVEVVGLDSWVIKILTDFFGKKPMSSMKASECVSKGCALECAILSPNFKVRDFQVQEISPFPIALKRRCFTTIQHYHFEEKGDLERYIVFPRGNPIPSVKAWVFYESRTFNLDVQYADASELQAPAKISTFTIGPFPTAYSRAYDVEVKVGLDLHGCVFVDSAELIEEDGVIWLPVSRVESLKGTTKTESLKGTTKMGTEKGVTDVEVGWLSDFINHQCSATNSSYVSCNPHHPGTLDKQLLQTFGRRPDPCKTISSKWGGALHDKLQEFVTDADREALIAKLQETEDWLYEDGEDETKGVYIAKLEELKKQGDPIEQRYKEYTERESFVDQLANHVNWYRQAAASVDPKYEHIDLSEKQKVLNECSEAENWLREKKQLQEALPKHADPVLLSSDIRKKAEALDRVCRPIMSKPKPAPPKPAATPDAPSPAPANEPSQGAENATNPNENPEAMETEKPETAA
ncbi:hypothetical protein OSB04_030548 [Centaurea solstitialis]|uniref:Heat shock 70 kDa protein 14 n=1 Tax=Centaurea solstitialis TaxID=347529 RepID=A0AA38W3X8_9ASTR|nr:hypothetical protein OSB04_030548 [Centaurea solstitialis]